MAIIPWRLDLSGCYACSESMEATVRAYNGTETAIEKSSDYNLNFKCHGQSLFPATGIRCDDPNMD